MHKSYLINTGFLFFLALMLQGMLQSCREECTYKPESFAVVEFRSVIDSVDQAAPVDSFSVYGVGIADSLYRVVNKAGTIELPLNGKAQESGFVMVFGEVNDTVWLQYDVVPWFLSEECGFALNYELTGTRHTLNTIKSVVIVTNEVTSFEDTNIRIYY